MPCRQSLTPLKKRKETVKGVMNAQRTGLWKMTIASFPFPKKDSDLTAEKARSSLSQHFPKRHVEFSMPSPLERGLGLGPEVCACYTVSSWPFSVAKYSCNSSWPFWKMRPLLRQHLKCCGQLQFSFPAENECEFARPRKDGQPDTTDIFWTKRNVRTCRLKQGRPGLLPQRSETHTHTHKHF